MRKYHYYGMQEVLSKSWVPEMFTVCLYIKANSTCDTLSSGLGFPELQYFISETYGTLQIKEWRLKMKIRHSSTTKTLLREKKKRTTAVNK